MMKQRNYSYLVLFAIGLLPLLSRMTTGKKKENSTVKLQAKSVIQNGTQSKRKPLL
jgi:hypothetical protein